MDSQANLPTYLDLGFSNFFERPMAQDSLSSIPAPTGGSSSGGQLNFDQVQTTGSLGDRIQVGNIIIDGTMGRITVSDGGSRLVIIGDIS
jgi:hypothetical protein